MNDVQDGLTNSVVSNGDREEEIDEESNSAKLFERSRIRALAGLNTSFVMGSVI